MAVAELIVSRRALLGAAFAVPLAPPVLSLSKGHPGLACPEEAQGSGSTCLFSSLILAEESWTPDQVRGDEEGERRADNWRTAVARFRRAEARLKSLAHEPDEDLFDNANSVFNHALKKLVRTPAPDLPALSLKIDLAVDHEVAELTGGEACLAALKRDAHRLAR